MGLIAAGLMVGCERGFYEDAQHVADPSKPGTIKIQKHPKQGYIYYLTVEGWGEVNGDAEISLMEGGKPYRTETLSGSFDFRWETDCYADSAEFRYTPSSVSEGTVWLRYRFKDQGRNPSGTSKKAENEPKSEATGDTKSNTPSEPKD